MQQMNDNDVISQIRKGMHVVDAAGEEVGTVEYVQMGDPEATTTAGNEPRPVNLVGALAETVLPGEAEPDVPEPLRTRLVRSGFIKIDAPGLLQPDRYVSSERIRDVAEDRVQLTVSRAGLVSEE